MNKLTILVLSFIFIAISIFAGEDIANKENERVVEYIKMVEKNGEMYYEFETAPYTGKTVKYYEGTKELSGVSFYKNGKKHGPFTRYHQNGKPSSVTNYENGLKSGEMIMYYANGDIKSKSVWKDGNQVGKTEWFGKETE